MNQINQMAGTQNYGWVKPAPTIRSAINELRRIDEEFVQSCADGFSEDHFVRLIKAAEDILKIAGAK